MLDVAAVDERLLAPFRFEQGLRDALVLLVALHDLGRISDSFRAMIVSGARIGMDLFPASAGMSRWAGGSSSPLAVREHESRRPGGLDPFTGS
jgi:hypothetical protein